MISLRENQPKRELKQKIAIIIVCLTLIITAVFILYPELPEKMIYTARPYSKIVSLGQSLTINAEEAETKAGIGYFHIPWEEGTMKITIDNRQIYNSYQEAGITESDIGKTLPDKEIPNAKFLLLDITLTSIDAKKKTTSDDPNSIVNPDLDPFEFLISSFFYLTIPESAKSNKNIIKDPYYNEFDSNIAYFSAHKKYDNPNDTVKHYYYFRIEEGETIQFQIGFWGAEEAFKDSERVLLLNCGDRSPYGFYLNK